jgi:hypothetical protein
MQNKGRKKDADRYIHNRPEPVEQHVPGDVS